MNIAKCKRNNAKNWRNSSKFSKSGFMKIPNLDISILRIALKSSDKKDTSFEWATVCSCRPKGCKAIRCQSLCFETKSDILGLRLISLSKSDSIGTGVTPFFQNSNFDIWQFGSPLRMQSNSFKILYFFYITLSIKSGL